MPPKTVLVTGANGFLGSAVCRTFSTAGWTTFGLVRNSRSVPSLLEEESIAIVGAAAEPDFITTLPPIDVIVTCSEDLHNYDRHLEEVLRMIGRISQVSLSKQRPKPLVIFSSGCKDYGRGLRHGDVALLPHTEESPLNPPPLLAKRATAASQKMFEYTDIFDCVVTRPTTLFGRSGGYYSYFFALADFAKANSPEGILRISSMPCSILHGTHVDDAAAAYLAIATTRRDIVAGQIYNISSNRYETLGEIVAVVEKAHGIKVVYSDPSETPEKSPVINALYNFSQWVDSTKIRAHTGWTDRKPLFQDGYSVYRAAFGIAETASTEQYERVIGRARREGGVL